MTTGFDTRQRPVRPLDQLVLVEAVRAGAVEESSWLEWKSTLQLGSKPAAVHLARAIMGFANRSLDDANRFVEGHAFILVGVARNAVPGVEWVDPVELGRSIEAYTGPRLRWSPTYLRADADNGRREQLLVIDVEPPRWGDPIHCAVKEGDGIRNGDVFVRVLGATQRATSADLEALSLRLLRRTPQVAVALSLEPGVVIPVLDPEDDTIDRLIEFEGQRALSSLPQPSGDSRPRQTPVLQFNSGTDTSGKKVKVFLGQADAALVPDALADPDHEQQAEEDGEDTARRSFGARLADVYASGLAENVLSSLIGPTLRDGRSVEEYRDEVAAYLDTLRIAWTAMTLHDAGLCVEPARLTVRNATQTNLTKTRVTLTLPPNVIAGLFEPSTEPSFPKAPRPYGTPPEPELPAHFLAALPLSGPSFATVRALAEPAIRHADATTIQFAPVDLRPGEHVELPPLILLLTPPADRVITARWEATCTNLDGIAQATLQLPTTDPDLLSLARTLSRDHW